MGTMRLREFILGAAFALIAVPAAADEAPLPPILRGTIAKVDAASISIVKADGKTVTLPLAPDASYSTVQPRNFEDIKSTDFVGVTSETGPDGKLQALEIHIFPSKGWNEGSFPWDHRPPDVKPTATGHVTSGAVAAVHIAPQSDGYTMTNASVTQSGGTQLKVSYRGSTMADGKCSGRAAAATDKPCTGTATVEVPPWVPVMAIVPGTAADAKAGRAVFAAIATTAPGKSSVTRLVLEKNGAKPMF